MAALVDDRPPTFSPCIHELAPAPDPWTLCQSLAQLPHLLFLDSAGGPAHLSRYSFLAADPFRWLQARGRNVVVTNSSSSHAVKKTANPFDELAEQLSHFGEPTHPDLPPFQGGAAGLFGYDLCHHLERLPRPRFDDFPTPHLAVGFYDWVLAFDHSNNRAWLIATGLPERHPKDRERRAQRRVEQILSLITTSPVIPSFKLTPPTRITAPCFEVPGLTGLLSSVDQPHYLDMIRRAVDYVHAGDCFQVNVAQRLLYPARQTALDLYGQLRQRNPAPFAGFFDMGAFQIASSSPERFARLTNGWVETRPIKGTRSRGVTSTDDRDQAEALLASEKDRAENVMIVDLLRNDLGRVCRYGTVRVTEVCQLETYETVHHLVSQVRGQLRDGLGPLDLLRAAFPGGSVTGAPKIRAMEIIAELEQFTRGPYCGSLGYLGFDGSMDTNILIRTFTTGHGWVQFPVGGGIVADSVPELEYEETWHKAKGAMRALVE